MLYEEINKVLTNNPNQDIVFNDRKVNYGWLLQQSLELAGKLMGQKYGIYCTDKLNCIIAMIACLSVDKTIVLFCPEYGKQFNKQINENALIENYITDIGDGRLRVLSNNMQSEEELKDTAYIIHTSGTTGVAKGVKLTQESLLVNIKIKGEYFPIDSKSSILVYRPIYHTATVFGEIMAGILAAAKIYIISSAMPCQYICQRISEYKITHLMGTPTILCNIINANKQKDSFSSVKFISVSGECMTKKIANALIDTFHNSEIHHCYGMTEAGPRVTALIHNFGKDFRCVGYPLSGVNLRLLDANGKEVQESNVVGALCVSGKSIMQGYYNDIEATQQVMKDNWYYTGDSAYRDEEGMYYVIGRNDQMHIRAGVNVWLRDIEESILENPEIEDTYVYLIEGSDKKIKADIVSKTLSIDEIWNWCIKNLAKIYLPDYIEVVKKIHVSKCGKKSKE